MIFFSLLVILGSPAGCFQRESRAPLDLNKAYWFSKGRVPSLLLALMEGSWLLSLRSKSKSSKSSSNSSLNILFKFIKSLRHLILHSTAALVQLLSSLRSKVITLLRLLSARLVPLSSDHTLPSSANTPDILFEDTSVLSEWAFTSHTSAEVSPE